MIKFEYLQEPKLQFGEYFEHEDTKTGLAEYGPFGKNIPGLHRSSIKLGFIGTRETIDDAIDWIERCGSFIESENVERVKAKAIENGFLTSADSIPDTYNRYHKILNRDFIGFNADSNFECKFQLNPRWERYLETRELKSVLEIKNKADRIISLVDFIEDKITSLTQTDPTPDIIIVALTSEIVDKADTVRVAGNFFLNLRRAIKARTMNQEMPVPVQLIRPRTVHGKGNVQEIATRAWNFCTAQYYKAGGIPWRPTTLEQDACYIGVSFYVAREIDSSLTMRSSIAQAFDYLGQGLILRGDQFEWDSDSLGAAPHLTKQAARKLISGVLGEYVKVRGVPPKRVVIHKTSEFWDSNRGDFNEIDGFYEGIDDIYRCESDFVTLRQTGIRLFREGMYPPLRGTYFSFGQKEHFLYTMGFIPYLETYPKPYVPEPWQIVQHIGGSSPKTLFHELLALTKMNVNNCAFADGTPITISFSEKVGEIMKHIPEDGKIQSSYRFYM
jgi:hypothetical protein